MKKTIFKTFIVLLSIILAVYIIISGELNKIISSLGEFGIIGVFIAGAFYGYGFTAAPATAAIIVFANSFNPLTIAFIGALGTMCGDYLIFHIIRDELPKKTEKWINRLGANKLKKIRKSKYSWVLPLTAGIFIASPLPNEIGISLLGITKYETKKFLLLVFCLDFIGILIIATLAQII